MLHDFVFYSRTNVEFCKFTRVRNADPARLTLSEIAPSAPTVES